MGKKVVIVPGNGAGDVTRANWYGWVNRKLNEIPGLSSTLRNMPDPIVATRSVWLGFMENDLNVDKDTIVVGHSSGACAAVRYAETRQVQGLVLVGIYITDLGDENEAASGYFSDPWRWEKVRENAGWSVVFGSTDDPFLSWNQQEEAATCLGAELHKYEDRGHFMNSTFPELVKVIQERLK